MQIVKATLKANPNNSVIGFKDNSSAIRCAYVPAPGHAPGRCAACLLRLAAAAALCKHVCTLFQG